MAVCVRTGYILTFEGASMTDIPPSLPPSPTHPLEEGLQRLSPKWRYFAGFGVLLVILGLLAIGMVVAATVASVLVIGFFMVMTGCLEVMIGFGARDWGRLVLWVATGLLYAAAGIVTISRPDLAAAIFTLLLGAGLVATGLVRLFLSSHVPTGHPRSLIILSSIVTVVFGGVIVLGWPGDSPIVLGTILGVDLLFSGIGWLGFGLALRSRAEI